MKKSLKYFFMKIIFVYNSKTKLQCSYLKVKDKIQ